MQNVGSSMTLFTTFCILKLFTCIIQFAHLYKKIIKAKNQYFDFGFKDILLCEEFK